MTQLSWELPFAPGAALQARHHVAEALIAQGAKPSIIETATLLISELVSNAVRYGDAPLKMNLCEVDGGWQLRVQDRGEARPMMRVSSLDQEGGRGLMLVDILSQAWGTEVLVTGGKEVWFNL